VSERTFLLRRKGKKKELRSGESDSLHHSKKEEREPVYSVRRNGLCKPSQKGVEQIKEGDTGKEGKKNHQHASPPIET